MSTSIHRTIHVGNIEEKVPNGAVVTTPAIQMPEKILDFVDAMRFLHDFMQLSQKHKRIATITSVTGTMKLVPLHIFQAFKQINYPKLYDECMGALKKENGMLYMAHNSLFEFPVSCNVRGYFVADDARQFTLSLQIRVYHIRSHKSGDLFVYGSVIGTTTPMYIEWAYSKIAQSQTVTIFAKGTPAPEFECFLIAD